MEVLFIYVSGLGNLIDDPISFLNQHANRFFASKQYSESISRVAIIFITQNLRKQEVSQLKTKYVKHDDKVGINIYLDNIAFIEQDTQSVLSYISITMINTFEKNKRLYKLIDNYESFLFDLKVFFEQVLDKNHRTI